MKKTTFVSTDVNLSTVEGVKAFLAKYDVDAKDDSGRTALIWDVFARNSKVIEYLLEHGADHIAPDNYGYNAYDYARNVGGSKIAQLYARYFKCYKIIKMIERTHQSRIVRVLITTDKNDKSESPPLDPLDALKDRFYDWGLRKAYGIGTIDYCKYRFFSKHNMSDEYINRMMDLYPEFFNDPVKNNPVENEADVKASEENTWKALM
jgi:hypothetical protein